MVTKTIWKSNEKFESSYKNSKIEIDGNGFSPKALLLSGLAACAGIDVVMILEKMRVPFAALEIEVETEQTDTEPKVFKDVTIQFKIKTETVNTAKVQKAVDLSIDKYCGVAAMLKKNSKIHSRIQIVSEQL